VSVVGAGLLAWLVGRRVAGAAPMDRRAPRCGPTRIALSAVLVLAGAAVVARSSGINARAGWVLAIAPAVYYGPAVERWLRRKRLWTLSIVAAAAIVAYGLAGDVLSAGWGPVDDHEIVRFLGPDRALRLNEILPLLRELEPARPGVDTRYRPSYYVIRVLETYLWGDAPATWYAARIAMFGGTLALFWRVLARWIGLLPAGIFIMYALTYRPWMDVWCHLGPSEAYALLGVALCLEGGSMLLRRIGRSEARPAEARTGWLLLTVGALLAMGAKENFLVILPAVLGLAVVLYRQGRLGWLGFVCTGVLTVCAAFIGAAVAIPLLRQGVDIYQTPVAAGTRATLVPEALRRAIAPVGWPDVGLGTLLAGAALVWTGHARRAGVKRVGPELLLVLALIALWVSQYVFYNGSWPTGSRYDLPGALTRPLLVVAAVVIASRVAGALRVDRGLTRALQAGLVAGLSLVAMAQGYARHVEACAAHAEATRTWTKNVNGLVARAHADPARAIVFVSHDPWDFEPVFALTRWLAARDVRNPLFLRLSAYQPDTPLARALAEGLERQSRGAVGPFRPLTNLPLTPRPLGIGLSGPPGPDYEDGGILWSVGSKPPR
jgi:hypothetical protein